MLHRAPHRAHDYLLARAHEAKGRVTAALPDMMAAWQHLSLTLVQWLLLLMMEKKTMTGLIAWRCHLQKHTKGEEGQDM